MAIMVAGGVTFAFPPAVPAMAQSSNPNLYVSAEDSRFNNHVAGPKVVEVVIIDPDIDETNEAKGEPDVTVNDNDIRMVQAADGKWYGYFAEYDQAMLADATVPLAASGEGLDFGTICSPDEAASALGAGNVNFFSDTRGVAFPFHRASYTVDPAMTPPVTATAPQATDCGTASQVTDALTALSTAAAGTFTAQLDAMNVVREPKAINTNSPGDTLGQIIAAGANADDATYISGVWPFVQLYDFSLAGTITVQYNRGGGSQSVSLTYDEADDFAELALDRASYPDGAEVHFTISDTSLDIDPTDQDSWSWDVRDTDGTGSDTSGAAYYQAFDENGDRLGATPDISGSLPALYCPDCVLTVDFDAQNTDTDVVALDDNADSDTTLTGSGTAEILTVTETGATTGVFASYDQADDSALVTTGSPGRDTTATIDYNDSPQSIIVGYSFATIQIQPPGDAWLSGQEIPVVLTDSDANKNSMDDEDFVASSPVQVPGIVTGSPATAANGRVILDSGINPAIPGGNTLQYVGAGGPANGGTVVSSGDAYGAFSSDGNQRPPTGLLVRPEHLVTDVGSQRSIITSSLSQEARLLVVDWGPEALVSAPAATSTIILQYDLAGLVPHFDSGVAASDRHFDVYLLTHGTSLFVNGADLRATATRVADDTVSGRFVLSDTLHGLINNAGDVGLMVVPNSSTSGMVTRFGPAAVIADLMSFGYSDDGVDAGERFANQVVRLELEESGDNTGVFEGTLEYVMVNQLNIAEDPTYAGLALTSDEASLVAIEDLTDEDTITVTYDDRGRDGVITPVSDDEAAPTHSGTVSFDATSYKIADTVTVTLNDADLNTSSDTIEVYTIPSNRDYVGRAGGVDVDNTNTDAAGDMIGLYEFEYDFGALGHLADITFDDMAWARGNDTCDPLPKVHGLQRTGFTLRETSAASGTFEGDFQVPAMWCAPNADSPTTVTGLDMEVNYVDYRDASGEIIEVGDGAGIRANTGSVSLDRPVYPVPFGATNAGVGVGSSDHSRFETYSTTDHDGNSNTPEVPEYLSAHPTMIHVRVTDPDFDVSASGTDTLSQDVGRTGGEGEGYGPLKVSVRRGSDEAVLGYAGGDTALRGAGRGVVQGGTAAVTATNALDYGALTETAPSSGTFELDLAVAWDHGPEDSACPGGPGETACILQGDILLVEYTDPADASGNPQTVTDSATFDMRNAVLRSDKSVYIIGSDMILTLIEPDLDLDNDTAETYTLDLIEWDDDDSVVTLSEGEFDPEPTSLRETGDSTGIFQVVVEIPEAINGDDLERGEEIELEYQDWSPAGANYVGETDEEIAWSIFTSDFGATIDLDQAVYTWTDKVFITIVAPDHNFDSNLIDRIGDTTEDPLQISTREGGRLDNYVLTETGTDTGIFSGEVILTGFAHDADGDPRTGESGTGHDRLNRDAAGRGPTDGTIAADDDDGITVSYEYNDDEHVIGSALIRWNVGDTQWLEASYPASGSGVVRVVDPDMNLNPEAVDNFRVTVYSTADAGGINLTVTETQEATGIFEGTVVFTLTDDSEGHRLRVAEGDTVTARYDDNTLPDPYTRNDELEVEGTTIIGTLVPPLERAVVSNVRLTDNSGNPLDTVAVGQQVQVTGQVASGQETDQAYAYLVQINDASDVTLSLTWTSGTLNAGQTLSPSMSWQPAEAGEYTATVFVWESIDNPTALSPQQELSFTVG